MEQDTFFTQMNCKYQLKACFYTLSHGVDRICDEVSLSGDLIVQVPKRPFYKNGTTAGGNLGDFEVNCQKPLSTT